MKDKTLRVLEYTKIIEKLKDLATSSLGKAEVEKLIPSFEFNEVEMQLKETSEAQGIILKTGNPPLGGIHENSSLIKKARIGSSLDPHQLILVAETMRAARLFKNFMKDKEESQILWGLAQGLSPFREIEDQIFNAIVGENEISDNASPELRRIRRSIVQKNEAVRSKLQSFVSSDKYQKYLQDTLITIRQDRFVIPVKHEHKSSVPGIVHDQSSSGATLFIEPMAIVNMNNELRELRLKEKEEIERILAELSALVGEQSAELIENQVILSKVDFIFAKGKMSIQMKAQEPFLEKGMNFHIKNGRHPLLDQKTVVPSNIWMGKDFKTLVITGPNTGGKTVTLKTVGLFALMTQSGLHIPVDYGSKMCIFQGIHADIGDEQSIEQSLSTFSSHMTHIVEIFEELKENSLVLFDELGAGTDPVEGAALAMSILDKLHGRKILTIATTHYSELKHYALTKEGVENASVEFDVESLSPTYRLLIGVPGKSNAFEISKKLGLSEEIIEAAKSSIGNENISFEDLLGDMESNRRLLEEEKQKIQSLRFELEKRQERIEEKESRIAVQRDKIKGEAQKEAQKILREAKDTADLIIKELREIQTHKDYTKDANRKVEKLRSNLLKSIKNTGVSGMENLVKEVAPHKAVKKLTLGEEVKIPSLNQEGTVISIDEEKREAQLQIGVMKMKLPFDSLEKKEKVKETSKNTGAGRIMKKKSSNIKTEVDLRGLNLEEAMMEVDKYLDDAYLSGIPQATIIHGVGTGVLKAGITDMLRRHKHIKSYRPGAYGEGGIGVTIVEFK